MNNSFPLLKEKRKQLGFTLAKVATDLDVSISLMSKLENGVTSLTEDMAEKLNQYYGLNLTPKKLVNRFEDYDVMDRASYTRRNKELKKENLDLKVANIMLKSKLTRIKRILDENLDD